jgi:hypothetical protein
MFDMTNPEFKAVREEVEAMKPGDKIECDAKLAIATAVIYSMPEARGGGLDFRIYDQPHAFGFIIQRRPKDAI